MRRTRLLAAALAAVGIVYLAYRIFRPIAPPDESGPPAVRFTNVTAAAGIRFTHTNGATPRKFLPETMGGGVVVLDYDGDGWPDLFFPNGRPWPGEPGPLPTQALYRNNRDGTFADVTAAAGLDVTLYAMGAAAADVDGDGWTDLFVAAVGASRLFKNVEAPGGGRRFADAAAAAGVAGGAELPTPFATHADPIPFPASAAFLDYDGDGKPDLFVCRYLTWSPAIDLDVKAELPGGGRAYVPPTQFRAADNVLYRNRGDGSFEDVSEAAGIRVNDGGKALGVVVCDADRDGWPDLFVACDTTRNLYFRNVSGSAGRRFEEVGMPTGLAYADGRPRGGMGADAAFLGADRLAVVVANFTNEPDTLFVTTAPGRFADAALAAGLAGPSRAPMKFGALFLDYDLDGRPDLLTCNGHLEPDIAAARPGETHAQAAQLFWNNGTRQEFSPVGADRAGPDLFRPLVGRGCAALDYDGDGDLDLVLVGNGGPARLLRNDGGANHALRLDVPAGSEATVEVGGSPRRFYATPARGYLSQSERLVTVGTGAAGVVERVVVRWPQSAGGTAEFTGLAAGVWRLRPGKAAERVR